MDRQQSWSTETYRDMEVHVTTLEKQDRPGLWDYTIRICEPGADAGSASELIARSGDDADYDRSDAALAAGFAKGYAMVDALRQQD